MRKVIGFILGLVAYGFTAISSLTIPNETISAGTPPQVVWVDQNFDSVTSKVNQIKDSINLYLVGGGSFLGTSVYSNSNLRLGVDNDANGTGNLLWFSHNATDSLFRIKDDSTWRAFGAGVGTKLTLSDSILAATARISGNGVFGGTLGITSLATLQGGALFSTSSSSQAGKVHYNSTDGLSLRGIAGATYDLILYSADAGLLFANPTGTRNVLLGHSSGSVTVQGTQNVTGLQTNSEAITFGAAGTSGSYRIFRSATNGLQLRGGAGSSYDLFLSDASGNAVARVPTGTSTLQFPNASGVSITGPASFSSTITTPLTASLPVFTNGSSQLTTNAMTGTGSVMMSASPTTTGTLTGAAANFSGAVTASTVTTGGGEAFAYGDTTFTLTATGMTTSPTGTAYATRIGRIVYLTIPFITGTSNSTSFTLTGIPSGWQGIRSENCPLAISDNNTVNEYDNYAVPNAGTITMYRNGSSTGWTSSGTKSVYSTMLVYTLQ